MKRRDDFVYLGDIFDAVNLIEGYIGKAGKKDFAQNHMMQDAVMHQIEIIGEASNSVSDEFQDKHPELPWTQMRAIRNKIVHDYREINLDIVWDTVKNNLPALKKQIQKLLDE